jgi:HK97 family phage prohead protease
MKNLDRFKRERQLFARHSSMAIDATRSKFEIEDRQIKGYPIVWGEKNDYDEIVLRGSTLNSLNARGAGAAKNPIVVLNQHRTSEILCRPDVLQEDEYGLYFEGKVIEGTRYADEALAQIRQGVLRQLSYGFSYVWDKVDYDEAADAYILREIKLYEISPVPFSSGESAQLRGYSEYQMRNLIGEFTPNQIENLRTLLSVQGAAATSTAGEGGKAKPTITIF